jgi:hypothetical protein
MWPFKTKKTKAELAIEWLPRAIQVATHKWLEFEAQPFATSFSLTEKIAYFSVGLKKGLGQWEAFKNAPPGLIALIAAKGVEQSGTHTKAEVEAALCIELPE